MKLARLLDGVAVSKLFQTTFGRMVVTHDVEVHSIQYDSRKIVAGDCFVAIAGATSDGHQFIQSAVANGAKVVVMENDGFLPDSYFMHAGVVKIIVSDSRKTLALMAGNYFEHPTRKMTVIGVTGTNGKTTTTHIMKSILEARGERVGLVGTIEYDLGNAVLPATHTTPESLELNQMFARMVEAGCTSVSMEVSSHALHQSRVYGFEFAAGVFTNLTQDHLDYHRTMEGYFEAKKILFDALDVSAVAITNGDDGWGPRLVSSTKAKVVSYGIDSPADVQATNVQLRIDGTHMNVKYKGETTEVQSPLVGRFNAYNALAAFTASAALGMENKAIKRGIELLKPVRGRFERLQSKKGWTAIIDYAHTPDALEKCLQTLHDVMPKERRGRIITVFGAGGDRDKTKRPLMGTVVGELSDVVIVTSDNPRTEDPEKVIDEILTGISKKSSVIREADRKKAIHEATRMGKPGDVILVAGKGHEEYQVVGNEKVHFSDREVIEEFA